MYVYTYMCMVYRVLNTCVCLSLCIYVYTQSAICKAFIISLFVNYWLNHPHCSVYFFSFWRSADTAESERDGEVCAPLRKSGAACHALRYRLASNIVRLKVKYHVNVSEYQLSYTSSIKISQALRSFSR